MRNDPKKHAHKKLFWTLAAALATISIVSAGDDILYPYELISPRRADLSWIFLLFGVLLGGATGYLAGQIFYDKPDTTGRGSPFLRNLMFAGFFALSTALLLGKLADRAAEMWTFSHGVVRTERFEYPVERFHVHANAPRVTVDPFGTGGVLMLISEHDLRLLRQNHASENPVVLCYRGVQQRVEGAVRVRVPRNGAVLPNSIGPCTLPIKP